MDYKFDHSKKSFVEAIGFTQEDAEFIEWINKKFLELGEGSTSEFVEAVMKAIIATYGGPNEVSKRDTIIFFQGWFMAHLQLESNEVVLSTVN